jgi:hypothetical protein
VPAISALPSDDSSESRSYAGAKAHINPAESSRTSNHLQRHARRLHQGWWKPAINLLGCIFFGISAVAGYVVPSTGSMIDLAAANWNTAVGAACFLACALATLVTNRTSKAPRLQRLRELEHDVARDLEQIV